MIRRQSTYDGGPLPRDQAEKTVVIKIGTSSLMHPETQTIRLSNISALVEVITEMKEQGYRVILVTSGGVGVGCSHMGICERPTSATRRQAISAVGQGRLTRVYDDLFNLCNVKVGQILATRTDVVDKVRFLNMRNTIIEMLELGVVPIVNENDALAVPQLRFGDNDTFAAYVAIGVGAKWLFLLTDVDFLYTKNPRIHKDAQPIVYVERINNVYSVLDEVGNTGTQWGSGGMRTKVIAAKIACATGVTTVLINGEFPCRIRNVLQYADEKTEQEKPPIKRDELEENDSIIPRNRSFLYSVVDAEHHQLHLETTCSSARGDAMGDDEESTSSHNKLYGGGLLTIDADDIAAWPYTGTIFGAHQCEQSLKDQRRWILTLPVKGKIYVDEGCARAIIKGKKSLLAAGVRAVEGTFFEGESVQIFRGLSNYKSPYEIEAEIARCLVNCSSKDIHLTRGLSSDEISAMGQNFEYEIAHRANICFIDSHFDEQDTIKNDHPSKVTDCQDIGFSSVEQ